MRRRTWIVLLLVAVGSTGLFSEVGAAASAFVGLVIGVFVVLLLEYRDSSFSSEEDIQRILTLPVLGAIPLMLSGREREMRRRHRAAIGLAEILLGLATIWALWMFRS